MFDTDNTYAHLPEKFYAPAEPAKPPQPQMIAWNESLAQELQLGGLSDQEKLDYFSGAKLPPGSEPIALAYAGHQFGNFVPQLGDGRAHLLGEVVSTKGERFDVQLKGSGATPFSRRGDGKSSLGPVLREYLVSEAMARLGLPTTRALAAVTTGETVYRDQAYPGGVFTRVASSHLRVGTFEYFAARQDLEGLRALFDYAVGRHYPELSQLEGQERVVRFFAQVANKQAQLVARWMSLGFIHGVMNTDNFSIAGITIDYGPCAFIDEFNFEKTFSSIDYQGRYAFGAQPAIAQWNLARLADCLMPLLEGDDQQKIQLLEPELDQFGRVFEQEYLERFRKKLGLFKAEDEDRELVKAWLIFLHKEGLDFTLSFRALSGLLMQEDSLDGLTPDLTDYSAFNEFEKAWRKRLSAQSESEAEVASEMNQHNPIVIPRNHFIEQVIEKAYEGDFSMFHQMAQALESPYELIPSLEFFAQPPKPEERVQQTFCGT